MAGSSTRRAIGCCAFLGVAQYFLYSVNFNQFFQGDALFWMYYRFHSVAEFLSAFLTLDVGHWYRPLSNRTFPSVLYPLFGLEPYGYHLVTFAVFFLTSCVYFAFVRRLTGSLRIAFLAAFYFSIHSINFYTTFDFAFAPELLYGLFYIVSVWLFVEWQQHGSGWARAFSAIAFVLSLTSKEAAATLPAVVSAYYILFVRGNLRQFARAVWLHWAVLCAHLVVVVGILKVASGDYMLILHRNVPANLLSAVYYAFNLRRDGLAPVRELPEFLVGVLVAFALIQVLLVTALLFRTERATILFGVAWFLIALSPMMLLKIVSPYYAFLPLAGLALVVGTNLDALWRFLEKRRRALGTVAVAGMLVLLWVSCLLVIVSDTQNDTALGYAGRWSSNAAAAMRSSYPELPAGANIYVLDESVPDLFRYGISSLFKLMYGDSVTTSYRSQAQSPLNAEGQRSIVLKAENERFLDVTDQFYREPAKFMTEVAESDIEYAVDSKATLRIEPAEVVVGRDSVWLTFTDLGVDRVTIQYTIDKGPVAEVTYALDPSGKLRFFVSDLTQPGLWEFLRFKPVTGSAWIKSSATLRVVKP